MREKKITIQIPPGKRAEWINGVLTLVDEPKVDNQQKVDNRPVTERVKTFKDALSELSRRAEMLDEHAACLLCDYESNIDNILNRQTVAYMRLAIIVAALNEGRAPQFEKGEKRYYPWFYLYTKKEYDKLNKEEKRHCVLRHGINTNAYFCFMYVYANYETAVSNSYNGSQLFLRTPELAEYAGRQFAEEWADFLFKPRTSK